MNTHRMASGKNRESRERLEKRRRRLGYGLIGCVVLALFLQITFFAQMSAKSKEIAQVDAQIHELEGQKENLQVYLSMYQSIDRVKSRAEAIGMRLPDEGQIRVVSVPGLAEDGLVQTADSQVAEASMR